MQLLKYNFLLFCFSLNLLFAEQASGILTTAQQDFFRRNGFLVIENFVEPEICQALRQQALDLVSQVDFSELASEFKANNGKVSWENYYLAKGQTRCFFFENEAFLLEDEYFDKSKYIKKISYALHEEVPQFKAFSYNKKLKAFLKELGVEDPLIVQSMYLFKQPLIGSEVACHQDSSFIHTEPDSLIGLWFALEEASIENGCLWVFPGAHQKGLKYKVIKNKEERMDYEIYDPSPWPIEEMIPLEVPKGSLIVMHGHLPHMSQSNRSAASRHAYALHLISGKSCYLPTNWHSLTLKNSNE